MTELARMLETEFRLPVPGASTKRLAQSASAGQIR
jgi:hypothetical protein